MAHNCRVCGEVLTDYNWYYSFQKSGNCICKECNKEKQHLYQEANRDKINAYARARYKNDPEKVKAIACLYRENNAEKLKVASVLYREDNRDKINSRARMRYKDNPEKWRAKAIRASRASGSLPMSKNKECSSYIGVHINERMLRHKFKDVQVMPYGNPGYDFVCNYGKKIDGKASCFTKDGRWKFHIEHNTIADYFICIAYDNRTDLNPLHIWMLPGDKFNHLASTSISPKTLHKWAEYEQNIDGVIMCCDTLRGI